jgi:hypothetical protein
MKLRSTPNHTAQKVTFLVLHFVSFSPDRIALQVRAADRNGVLVYGMFPTNSRFC